MIKIYIVFIMFSSFIFGSEMDKLISQCNGGNVNSCTLAAENYKNKNMLKKSLELFEKACLEGDNRTCTKLSLYYDDKTGDFKKFRNYQKSLFYSYKGCNEYTSSCFSLASKYFLSKTLQRIWKDNPFVTSEQRKSLHDNIKLISKYINEHTDKMINSCNKDDGFNMQIETCMTMGKIFYYGDISGYDIDKSLEYFNKACMFGNKIACGYYSELMNTNSIQEL